MGLSADIYGLHLNASLAPQILKRKISGAEMKTPCQEDFRGYFDGGEKCIQDRFYVIK